MLMRIKTTVATLDEGDWEVVPGTSGTGAFSEATSAPKMFYHVFRFE